MTSSISGTKRPRVSILIPAFKAQYLHQAIASVLNQTMQDLELIIINDCSPDDLTSIVASFSDRRIRYYINDRNLGHTDIVANWNKCLSYARGDFFALLCDDDLYAPYFIERMLTLAERYPDVAVFRAGVNIADAQGSVCDYYPASPAWESCGDYLWHVLRGYRCQTVSEFLYRRPPVVALGGYVSLPLAWYSDFLSTFRFAAAHGIASTSERLVTFRMSPHNITARRHYGAMAKAEASRRFEEALLRFIDTHCPAEAALLHPLLRQWLASHRLYGLKVCPSADFVRLACRHGHYNIDHKTLFKALLFRCRMPLTVAGTVLKSILTPITITNRHDDHTTQPTAGTTEDVADLSL